MIKKKEERKKHNSNTHSKSNKETHVFSIHSSINVGVRPSACTQHICVAHFASANVFQS